MINPIELSTDKLYFADEKYMSVSAFKKFQKCEVGGLIPFGESTPSMLVGSYVDAFVSGTLEEFKLEHPEIISSRGESKGQLKAEFKQADEICENLSKDETFMQFMSGEKQTVMTGEIDNVPFKIKMDSYSKGVAINDLKCMATVTNRSGQFYDFISLWGYDIQMACYQEIVYQNTGEKLPCFVCAVTKENPINKVIVNVPQFVMDKALYKVQCNVERYYNIKSGKLEPIGCGICKACIGERKQTPIISMEQFVDFGM